jgi:hypothetical protein
MFKLASSIGLALAVADLKRRIRHWVRSGVFGAVGALLAIISLCFFLVAAHLALSRWLNPIASAAIIGGVLLVIALILFFIASRPMAKRTPMPTEVQPTASIGETIREGMARFGGGEALLRHPLFPAAVTALVAGFFLGRRSKRDRNRDRD